MGKPVTVDSDDLEKVLMSTGMIKSLEEIIRQTKNDPFICKDDSKLRDAHDNVSKAWRNATREVCHPKQNEPLTSKAYALLKSLGSGVCVADPVAMKNDIHKELFIKLMIEYGQAQEVVFWGGSNKAEQTGMGKRVLIRVTPKGHEMLLFMATQDKSSIQ